MPLKPHSWLVAAMLAALAPMIVAAWSEDAVADDARSEETRAEDSWQPFNPFAGVDKRKAEKAKRPAEQGQSDEAGARAYLRPMASPEGTAPANGLAATPGSGGPSTAAQDTVMRDAIPPPVEKGDLTPVMADDGSGLPFELWRGLDAGAVETLIKDLEIPPRSPALHNLWKRLITSSVTPASGDTSSTAFAALRLEVLYRSGLAADAAAELAKQPVATDPLIAMLAARNELASGNAAKACEIAQQSAGLKGAMPPRMKSQAILMSGYCAALANDAASAGLAAELAREEGQDASPGLEALDAISIGAMAKITPSKMVTLLDYRLVERAGGMAPKDALEKGEPALLAALANDTAAAPDLRLLAAESAARLNAISPDALGGIYRALAGAGTSGTLLTANQTPSPVRRAALFKAIKAEPTPAKKTRLMRELLDDAKRHGLQFQTLLMLAPAAASLNPQLEIKWFAETGAEIGLASGQLDLTRRWIALGSAPGGPESSLSHWLALVDIADPNLKSRGESLAALESLAVTGRLAPDALHRLATVLDALNYNVPIPLWDAASRTPQPNSGYLPPTGVLSELQDAAKKKEFGRTVLLAMKALGPNGAEGAHMIALGDSIRALKRAGLEPDARRLGLEALLGSWPRTAVN